MNDKKIYLAIVTTGLICSFVGAGVQHAFDDVIITSQRETIGLYKAELMEWVDFVSGDKDSDGDGVTDWDEIFVYHTDPLSSNSVDAKFIGINSKTRCWFDENKTSEPFNLSYFYSGIIGVPFIRWTDGYYMNESIQHRWGR